MAVQLRRHMFTVKEYHRMAEAGIFGEDDRVELLEGEIVEMTPIGSGHAACVDRLTHLLVERVRGRAIVRVQSPIRLGQHSEPQPDLAVLKPRSDFYAKAHPGPEDVLLIVEVAETSADSDRAVKVPLYARAGIPEVWLVDLTEVRIEVYSGPMPQGYQEFQTVRSGQRLSPRTVPDVELAVEAVLG